MFNKLRGRLTLVCAASTMLVVVGMAAVSLHFSLERLEQQAAQGFESALNAVLFYLGGTGTIDHTWLRQTEEANGLYIRIETEGVPLHYTALDGTREMITSAVKAEAQRLFGEGAWAKPKSGVSPEPVFFTLQSEGEGYRAATCLLPREGGDIALTLVGSRAAQDATARGLWLVYLGSAAGAVVLLALFAWLFTGRALRPATEAAQRQTEFISAASHELRSPLAVIGLSAGTIRTQPGKADACAATIEAECARMGRLLADLLVLAGSDSGMRLAGTPTSPKTLLLATSERFEPLAAEGGVRLRPSLPEGSLPEGHWDAARVEQILAVLVENALCYTPNGGEVRLSVREKGAGAEFRVEDSGPGIPDAEKKRVFQRFYRAGDDARSDKEHYGLGLSVAAALARLHDGRLRVEDSPLGGAAFLLYLPYGGGEK